MTLKQLVYRFFDETPVQNQPNKYRAVMKEFGISLKKASAYWLSYTRTAHKRAPKAEYSENEVQKILKQEGDNLNVTVKTEFEVKSLEDLLLVCDVDIEKWNIESWQCRKWDVGTKETKQLFSVSAKFKAKNVEQDLVAQKQILLKELFAQAPVFDETIKTPIYQVPSGQTLDVDINVYPYATETFTVKRPTNRLLEICLFDLHFGKLAHREEVGEDYDIKIAELRFKQAVNDLISRVDLTKINTILLPIGQDLINVDNLVNKTTAGTPQDSDSRFHKIVKVVKSVLIETINMLSQYAFVDVVISVGNHDEQSTFMIGEMLDAYYHKSEIVKVYNDASLRKYYQFGVNSIMFTHGDKERFQDLGMIFAAENPSLWANTKQRFIQIGHYHHNKKVSNVQAQEFQGFQIQILPSLSGSDAWHVGKGYHSLKQAKAFLFDDCKGLIGEFTYTAE